VSRNFLGHCKWRIYVRVEVNFQAMSVNVILHFCSKCFDLAGFLRLEFRDCDACEDVRFFVSMVKKTLHQPIRQ
jgi:hypothetical protein